MKSKGDLVKQTRRTLKRAIPVILTCLGAVGVVATAILAVKGTPKALEEIKNQNEEKLKKFGEGMTRSEIVAVCWKNYIPAAVTGAATIGCILGASILNQRQQASLATAYALINHSYTDYKHKLKELFGEDAHKQIVEAIAIEKSNYVHITSSGFLSSSCLEFEDADEEIRLFYDSFSERYFQSTISKVLEAEYHLNRNFALMGGFIPVNMFYEFLGIKSKDEYAGLGCSLENGIYWVDFNHTKAMVDDGIQGEVPCYIIDMEFLPGNDSEI